MLDGNHEQEETLISKLQREAVMATLMKEMDKIFEFERASANNVVWYFLTG